MQVGGPVGMSATAPLNDSQHVELPPEAQQVSYRISGSSRSGSCSGRGKSDSAASFAHAEAMSPSVAASVLQAEHPKVWLIISDKSGHLAPQALKSFWRSQELPILEEANVEERLERLLLFLRGEKEGLLEVRESLLPGAGRGLFARHAIAKGMWLCVYTGTVHSLGALLRAKNNGEHLSSDYLMGGFGLFSVDAGPHPEVLARYINDPYNNPERRNVYFLKLRKPRKALVVALRDIEPGDELYAEYGSSYWRHRGVTLPGDICDIAEDGAPEEKTPATVGEGATAPPVARHAGHPMPPQEQGDGVRQVQAEVVDTPAVWTLGKNGG